MKRFLVISLFLLGCEDVKLTDGISTPQSCDPQSQNCANSTDLVLKDNKELKTLGTIEDVKSVDINLALNGTYVSKSFQGTSAIDVVKFFNLAFPKKSLSKPSTNPTLTGFITLGFSTSAFNQIVYRDFYIENTNVIRDQMYPEITYRTLLPLTVNWLNSQE